MADFEKFDENSGASAKNNDLKFCEKSIIIAKYCFLKV